MLLNLKPHIFSDLLTKCCCKIRVFRFQRELNKFLWTLKHSLKNKVCLCKRLFPSPFSCDVMMHIICLSFSNIYELLIVLLFKAWHFSWMSINLNVNNYFLKTEQICIFIRCRFEFFSIQQHICIFIRCRSEFFSIQKLICIFIKM